MYILPSPDTVDELDAFFLEHRRCGELDTGVEDGHPVIDRRMFLAGTGAMLVAAPRAAGAQQPMKTARIGILSLASGPNPNMDILPGLRELGWIEGQNMVVEYRWAAGLRPVIERMVGKRSIWLATRETVRCRKMFGSTSDSSIQTNSRGQKIPDQS